MSFVAAAVAGAGILGAGASIYGANRASNAQQDAANQAAAVQREGQNNALAFQKDVYGNQLESYGATRGNLQPFVTNGINASNTLAGGMNGNLASFYNSPDYQFALKGGSDALDNSAAARGGMIGGNQMRAQTEYGAGLATQNLQSYFARLSGMAGQGIQAGGALGTIGAGLGNSVVGANANTNIIGSNNIAQSNMAAGTAEAAGINGMVGGFQKGLGSLSLYSQLGRSSYGGGATGGFGSSGGGYDPNQIGGRY